MNKKEKLERNLLKIDLSVIEAGIKLDKKIRKASLVVRVTLILLIGAAITTSYLYLNLYHKI